MMNNYELTLENGVITCVHDTDDNGNPIPGILHIPQDATSFSPDAWVHLGADALGITVHPDNPSFSAAHNCLLSKDGTKLIKTCQTSDLSKLTGLKVMGQDAFQSMNREREVFSLEIPEGVQVLNYRSFAISADRVQITVPASVLCVDLLAFMIHSNHTHIIFRGDPQLRIGTFGTAAEAKDSGNHIYRSMPAIVYPKAENITVTCQPNSRVAAYCREYGIPVEA